MATLSESNIFAIGGSSVEQRIFTMNHQMFAASWVLDWAAWVIGISAGSRIIWKAPEKGGLGHLQNRSEQLEAELGFTQHLPLLLEPALGRRRVRQHAHVVLLLRQFGTQVPNVLLDQLVELARVRCSPVR